MAANSHLQGFSPLNPFPIDTFPSHPHTHTFFFLDSGTAWLGFQSRFQCLWGLWTRVWAAESDLGIRPRSNYVEKKTKAGRTHIGF